jgi:hypothetical protein
MRNIFSALLVLLNLLTAREVGRARNVTLAWNASASLSTAGYNVYYGTASGTYPKKISPGNVTSTTLSNLTEGATYYFVATACDLNANESPRSTETSFIVPGVLSVSRSPSTSQRALLSFPVEPGHYYEVQATTNFQSWTSLWQTGVSSSNAWVQFSDSSSSALRSRFYRLALH